MPEVSRRLVGRVPCRSDRGTGPNRDHHPLRRRLAACRAVCIETTFPPELDLAYFFADGTSLAALAVTGTIALCITDGSWPVWPPGSQPSTVQADTASYDLSDPGYGYERVTPPAAPGQFNGFLLEEWSNPVDRHPA